MTEKNFYALFDKPTSQNLEANQRGRLTLEQQSALEQMAKNQRAVVVFWGAMILAVVGLMIFFFWQVAGSDGFLSTPSILAIGVVAVGAILLIVFLSGGDVLFSFSRADIENGQVESVVGKVIWTGRRYRMVSDSRKLKSLQYGRTLPPPGDYRFYCLPESGLVLIAEELGLMSASQPKDLLLDALASANHFSMDDLQSNREGLLSGGQEIRLFGYASLQGVMFLLSAGVFVWIIRGFPLGEELVWSALLGLIGLIVSLRTGWSIVRVIWDMWNGKIARSDGQVARYIHKARNTRYYTYQVNGLKFYVSQSAYNALIEGREYRVYYAPRSKRLVAIEPT